MKRSWFVVGSVGMCLLLLLIMLLLTFVHRDSRNLVEENLSAASDGNLSVDHKSPQHRNVSKDVALGRVESGPKGVELSFIDSVDKRKLGSVIVYLFSLPDIRKPAREVVVRPGDVIRMESSAEVLGWSAQRKGYYTKVWLGMPKSGTYALVRSKPVQVALRHMENAVSPGLRIRASLRLPASREDDSLVKIMSASIEWSKRISPPLLVGNVLRVDPPVHDGMRFIVSARGRDDFYVLGMTTFEKGVYEYEIDVPSLQVGNSRGSLRIELGLPKGFDTPVDFHLRSAVGVHPVDAAFAPRRVEAGSGKYSAFIPSLPEGLFRFEVLFMKVGLTYRSRSFRLQGDYLYEDRIQGETVEIDAIVPESYKQIDPADAVILAYADKGIHVSGTIRGRDGRDRLFIPKETLYLMAKAGPHALGTHPYPVHGRPIPDKLVLEPLYRVRLDFGPDATGKELIDVFDVSVRFTYPQWTRKSARTERKVFLVRGRYRIRRKGGPWVSLELPKDANKVFQLKRPPK